jgi:hypothetical protein
LVSDSRRWRLRCHEHELQVIDDPIHHLKFGKEGDDLHLSAALGADQRIDFIETHDRGRFSPDVEDGRSLPQQEYWCINQARRKEETSATPFPLKQSAPNGARSPRMSTGVVMGWMTATTGVVFNISAIMIRPD